VIVEKAILHPDKANIKIFFMHLGAATSEVVDQLDEDEAENAEEGLGEERDEKLLKTRCLN
jgi:hypothetical protein